MAPAVPTRTERVPQTPAEADKDILSGFRLKNKEEDRMSQIGRLYQAYCTEQKDKKLSNAEEQLYEMMSEILPNKEYTKAERLLGDIAESSDEEFFIAGFRAATRLWAEAVK